MTSLADRRLDLIADLRAKGTYQRWVLITCLVGVFATSFPVTILTVSLGDIADDLGTSEAVITWVVSAPMLAGAVALPMLGRLGDVLGQRRVFLVGFALSALSAVLTAIAWDPLSLISFRTLSQVIGAGTGPTSMALIMREIARSERVKAMGWWSLVGAGSPAFGLVVGGPLVELIGWRPVFIAQAVFSIIPVAVAWFVLEEVPPTEAAGDFDVMGAITLALSAGGIMFALTQGVDWGWSDPRVLGAAAMSPLAAVAFVQVERRARSPLLPLGLLRRRNFVRPLIAEFFGGAAYMGAFVVTPLLMRGVLGWELSAVALIMVLRPLFLSIFSPVGGQLGSRLGEQRTAVLGITILAGSMAVFVFGARLEIVVLVAAALILQGIGMGIYGPSIGAILINSVDDNSIGLATATQRMVQQVGNALGIALLTAVAGGAVSAAGYGRSYLAALVLASIGLLVVVSIGRTGPLPRRGPNTDDDGDDAANDETDQPSYPIQAPCAASTITGSSTVDTSTS